jgi:hypothetical protein
MSQVLGFQFNLEADAKSRRYFFRVIAIADP